MIGKAAVALAVAGSALAAIDFDLKCQPPTRQARLSYVVDTSSYMTPYHNMLSAGALQDFDVWMGSKFDTAMSTGLMKFSQKKASSTADDVCSAIVAPLQFGPILPLFNAMVKGVGGDDKVSVLDALYMGGVQDWSTPHPAGRTILVVFTSKAPELPPNDAYVPWTSGCDCEVCDYPQPSDVAAIFSANYQFVLFVVTADLVPAYEEFKDNVGLNGVVLPMVEDVSQQGLIMARGINEIYCGKDDLSTEGDDGLTVEPFSTHSPVETSSQPPLTLPMPTISPPCSAGAILQLVHLQDVSWSYTNDLQNMKDKFPMLLPKLDEDFFRAEKGLASFVDKGVSPSGYPYDWCYRQETAGFVDNAAFINALDSLKHSSGKDWKESQYDAIYEAIEKPGFDWIQEDYVDDKKVLRVVMLATDALPHVKGDQEHLEDDLSKPCEERDYPSVEELKAALAKKKVVPLFVVTSDIYNSWTSKAKDLHENARVLHLSQSPKDLFDAIVSTLQHYCVMM